MSRAKKIFVAFCVVFCLFLTVALNYEFVKGPPGQIEPKNGVQVIQVTAEYRYVLDRELELCLFVGPKATIEISSAQCQYMLIETARRALSQ